MNKEEHDSTGDQTQNRWFHRLTPYPFGHGVLILSREVRQNPHFHSNWFYFFPSATYGLFERHPSFYFFSIFIFVWVVDNFNLLTFIFLISCVYK